MRAQLLMSLMVLSIVHGCHGMEQERQAISTITTISSFDEAADVLDEADENTLVVFDVDDTLIAPKNIPSKEAKINHYDRSIYLKHVEFLVIEPTIVECIKELQKKSRVIALTHMHNSSYAAIQWYPQWRYDRLKECNIDFSSNHVPERINFEIEGSHAEPVFYNGILATDCTPKGTVLAAFLAYCKDDKNWTPSRVIFFDDKIENVESVEQALSQTGIDFTGFHYDGLNHITQHVDDEIVQHQIENVIAFKIWPSFEDAKKSIHREKKHDDPAPPRQTSKSRQRQILSKWCSCKRSADVEPS